MGRLADRGGGDGDQLEALVLDVAQELQIAVTLAVPAWLARGPGVRPWRSCWTSPS